MEEFVENWSLRLVCERDHEEYLWNLFGCDLGIWVDFAEIVPDRSIAEGVVSVSWLPDPSSSDGGWRLVIFYHHDEGDTWTATCNFSRLAGLYGSSNTSR